MSFKNIEKYLSNFQNIKMITQFTSLNNAKPNWTLTLTLMQPREPTQSIQSLPNQIVNWRIKFRPANKTLILKPGDPRLKSYYPDEPVNNIKSNQSLSNQSTMMQNGKVIPMSELWNAKRFTQKFTPKKS